MGNHDCRMVKIIDSGFDGPAIKTTVVRILKDCLLSFPATAQAVESGKVELNPPTSPVAGTETGIGEWPWMVAIKRRTDSISFMGLPDFSVNLSMCNGVLLDERHVLTAASCVHSTAVRPVSVTGIRALLGEHDVYASDEILTYNSSVARVVFPLTFNPRLWKHNLAILQLSKPVDYTRNIRPICLPVDYNVFRTDDAVVTRWEDEPLLGVPNGLTNKVVAFNVQILNETYCSQSLYSSFDELLRFTDDASSSIDVNDFVCVEARTVLHECGEEISVPLVRRDQTGAYFLAGVSKSNINCNDLFPTVYTRIGQISNFLNIALQLTATSMK
ncbi:Mannan-binding lectin serine protease 1 [Halocaridina rubra]|uniref:Mannan-binding lectin serine protease 1 n=1 Tax=Halocaridina rubra TaxID=373956 RepID=A0AAN8WF16_HALRR